MARRNLLRRTSRRPGITSSTTRIADRSRHAESDAPAVVVRVVTPRITLITPPELSTGVTPPKISWSTSLSSSRTDSPFRPSSSAPPSGTAGSLSPAMAPATAAARGRPEIEAPPPSTAPGATSTTRSWFSSLARSMRPSTLSSRSPASTHRRSRRRLAASATLSRSFFCTARSVLSHSTRAMPSILASWVKAAS